MLRIPKTAFMNKFLIIFICFINFVSAQKTEYLLGLIPDNLKESVNSCIIEQLINVDIKSQRKYTITTRKVVTVFNKFGINNIDAREYFDKSTAINSMEATIYNSFGGVIKKIRKSDFKNESVADGFTISDNRILFLDYTPTEYPFTIVFESELESSNTAFLPQWRPVDDYFESVQKSTFSITYPPELGFKFKEFNFENRNIAKIVIPYKIVYTIESVTAEKPEVGSSTFKNIVPKVLFALEKFSLEGVEGSAKTWTDFGLWMNKSLLVDADEVSAETKAKIISDFDKKIKTKSHEPTKRTTRS